MSNRLDRSRFFMVLSLLSLGCSSSYRNSGFVIEAAHASGYAKHVTGTAEETFVVSDDLESSCYFQHDPIFTADGHLVYGNAAYVECHNESGAFFTFGHEDLADEDIPRFDRSSRYPGTFSVPSTSGGGVAGDGYLDIKVTKKVGEVLPRPKGATSDYRSEFVIDGEFDCGKVGVDCDGVWIVHLEGVQTAEDVREEGDPAN